MKCSASSVTGAPTRSTLYLPRGMSGAFTAFFLLAPTQHIGGRIHGAVEVGLAYRDFMNFAAVGATQSERFRPRHRSAPTVGVRTSEKKWGHGRSQPPMRLLQPLSVIADQPSITGAPNAPAPPHGDTNRHVLVSERPQMGEAAGARP